MQPSWLAVDFDNWRDWEHEEDEGKEEFDRYADVSQVPEPLNADIQFKSFGNCAQYLYLCNIKWISLRVWIWVCEYVAYLFQMILDMSNNKGGAPDMGDLSDVSAVSNVKI